MHTFGGNTPDPDFYRPAILYCHLNFNLTGSAHFVALFRDHAGSAYHPCGTCRMHADDSPDSVVDCSGRVKGIEGLRVIDASIIPSIPSSNINAVVMMIAEKLAHDICA